MYNKLIDNQTKIIIDSFNQLNNKNSVIRDLTYLKTYSIDDSQTLEIDDAISLEKIASQFRLWIHIACPTSYIEYNSDIDRNARKRISSLYLSTDTSYMLPEVLINEVFSLSLNEKRESISLGVILNEDGSVYSSEIVLSLIKVDYRLNYTDADELIDYAPKEEEDLSIISSILKRRKSWRMNLGALEILESYGKIIVDDEIPTIKIIDPTLSRQLISEAMILYGHLTSEFTKLNKIPVPYRVQESRHEHGKDNIEYSDNDILYNFLLKKKMCKSYYSINPLPHNSLGLTSYLHATSPIRRYADLLVNYQLNNYLNNRNIISEEDVKYIIHEINKQARQNTVRYREDQRYWLSKWFENNLFKEYQVILLNWINRYKNICILYFIEYNISTTCNLNSDLNLNIGQILVVKNIFHNNKDDLIYFELVALSK